jgi:hypothetical protein
MSGTANSWNISKTPTPFKRIRNFIIVPCLQKLRKLRLAAPTRNQETRTDGPSGLVTPTEISMSARLRITFATLQ